MNLEVSFEDYADHHCGPLFELFASYFQPDDRLLTTAYTRWLYAENPFGLARMVKVTEGERWVGFMAMIPVRLARQGEALKAYFVVNVLVHPAFHGKHLFGRMISAAKTLVKAEGAVLMGHPNDMAIKSWQRARMHFHEALRPGLALPKPWVGGLGVRKAKEVGQLAAAALALDEIVSQSEGWRVAATPTYLDWRFLRHPSQAYEVQVLEVQGAVAGIQITRPVRPGVRLLVDQFVRPQDTKGAIARLPPLTLCFWPESVLQQWSTVVWALPWKKRIPFFFTSPHSPETAAQVANLGLSASDF